jgi:hypothetical protein
MQIHLRKFDMASLPADAVVVMIARRGSGKSYLVRDVLYNHRDIPIGTVISPTERANKFYTDFMPSLFIHDEYTPEITDNFVKRQELVMKKVNKEKTLYGKSTIDPHAFIILDDCLYDQTWIKDKNIRYLFYNGRHVKSLVIITCQYPLGLPPTFRCNIDVVFIFKENITSNQRRIYENFAGIFQTFEIFRQVLMQCTEDYHALVIVNNSKSSKLEDNCFWYKAPDHKPFTLGSREVWQLQNEIGRNDDDDDEDMNDNDNITSIIKQKGPTVSVKRKL